MDEAITPPSAINPAPILGYYTSTAPPVGLRVEETPTEWVLELHPPTVGTELRKSVAWATMVSIALALTPLVVIHLFRTRGFDPRVAPAASALVFLAGWPPPGKKTTITSTSLSGAKSSRRTEPKSASSAMFHLQQNAAIRSGGRSLRAATARVAPAVVRASG